MRRRNEGGDYELNIVPVLDSLVVLISFLLLSAAYANFVLLDATIPTVILKAIEKSHNEREKFRITLTVENKRMTLAYTGQKKRIALPMLKNGKYDLKRLHTLLVDIKKKHPDRFSIDFDIKADIDYGTITTIMDESRNLWASDGEIDFEGHKLTLLFPDIVLTGVGT